jgi:phosphatidylserine/phosphatidylglycerophosphate/cardiolipin synthase-like enzyme
MPPQNKRKKIPEDYHVLAESRGFRWLGPEVSTTKTLTTWECPKGHQWQAIYNNIQQGRDCPYCTRRKKPSDYHLLAYQRNFQWLGPPVTSMIAPTNWKCGHGHEWQTTYRNILRGDDCPVCYQNKPEQNFVQSDVEGKLAILTEENLFDEQEELLTSLEKTDCIDPDALLLDWWGKKSIEFLRPFFRLAKTLIRISTGFFSIQGYGLLKSYVEGKRLYILVGYDERSKQDVKMTLIEEIKDDLSRWHGNRRETVLNLVEKLWNKEFRMVDARTRQKDHSKVYIFDEEYVIGGSTNLTKSGLLHNHEGDLAISRKDQPGRIEWWSEQYEKYWNDPGTDDISQDLLDWLEKWLKSKDDSNFSARRQANLTPREL